MAEGGTEEPTKQCTGLLGPWKKLCDFKLLKEYYKLLKQNKSYRLYLLSQACQHFGDKMVTVTSLASVQMLGQGGSHSVLSQLLGCNLIPRTILTPIGGLLADRFDRRLVMMNLDFLASLGVLSFVVAHRFENVNYLFIATLIRSVIDALGKPAEHAIVPMLVSDPEDLLRIVTLNGIVSGAVGALAGYLVGGGFSANTGPMDADDVEWCYFLDSAAFLLSGLLMWKASGSFPPSRYNQQPSDGTSDGAGTGAGAGSDIEEGSGDASSTTDDDSNRKKLRFNILLLVFRPLRVIFNKFIQPVITSCNMMKEMFTKLGQDGYLGLFFLKASYALTWGTDVLVNPMHAQVQGDPDGLESNRRLGTIYTSQGFGAVVGIILAAMFIADGRKPRTIQLGCISGLSFAVVGYLGLAYQAPTFEWVCFYNFIKWLGGSVMFLYSTLLFQNLVDIVLLGRAISVDFSIASFAEGLMVYTAMYLIENEQFQKIELALTSAGVAGFLLAVWSSYHISGKGAPMDALDLEEIPPAGAPNQREFTFPSTENFTDPSPVPLNEIVCLRSVASGNYLDSTGGDAVGDGRYPLLADRDPAGDTTLQWYILRYGEDQYAFKSVANGDYLDGAEPGMRGVNLFLTQRHPEGDNYLLWKLTPIETTDDKPTVALQSVSSSQYLHGGSPQRAGERAFLVPRGPRGNKYVHWEVVQM